jgi:putative addiction module component (TIGR02574 family)
MTKLADQLLETAKTLTAEEREELAARLRATLGSGDSPEYVSAWDAELARRIAAIDNGQSKLVPADEAIARIQRGQANDATPD